MRLFIYIGLDRGITAPVAHRDSHRREMTDPEEPVPIGNAGSWATKKVPSSSVSGND
jgi:hypothetical protein